jgi:cytidylate kinase
METDNKFIITINRQLGTDDHEIGMRLAERLHIRYVDKEILGLASKMLEVDKKELEKLESKSPTWWEDFIQFSTSPEVSRDSNMKSKEVTTRQLYYAQADIIKLLADVEPCVIMGRCAFDILKERKDKISLFLHDTIENRVKNVMHQHSISEKDAIKMIKDSDKQRESYTKTFTGKIWEDARNYDFTLNVGILGIEKTVETIIGLINKM